MRFINIGVQSQIKEFIPFDKYKKQKGDKMSKIQPKIVKEIPEGKITGEIIRVEERLNPYAYTDFVVKVDEYDVERTASFPSNISLDSEGNPKSELAVVCVALGMDITQEIETQDAVGKKVQCVLIKKPSKKDRTKIFDKLEGIKLVK